MRARLRPAPRGEWNGRAKEGGAEWRRQPEGREITHGVIFGASVPADEAGEAGKGERGEQPAGPDLNPEPDA